MIKRKFSSMMAFLLAVVLVLNTLAPMAYAAGNSDLIEEVEMTRVSLEDFESFEDTAALGAAYKANANGMANSVELVDSPVEGGGKAMAFTYNTAGAGSYTGVSRSLSVNAEGAETLAVWFQGDGMGQRILLQIQHAGGSHKVYLPDLEEFDPESTEPQYLEIPLSAFGPIDTTDIRSFDVYVDGDGDPVSNSTLIVDSVELLVPKTVYTLVVDDFSSYADDAAIREAYAPNVNGDTNTLAVIDSPFADGGKAMQFSYQMSSAGYSGAVRSIAQSWFSGTTLNMWFQGDGSRDKITVQISDGDLYSDGTHTFEVNLNDLEGYDEASTEPQYIQIPLSAFAPKEGARELDVTNISSIAIYVGWAGRGSGTFVVGPMTVSVDEDPNVVLDSEEANIDNFEDYADDAALAEAYVADANGGSATVLLQRSPFNKGGIGAMRVDYNTAGGAYYAGVAKAINEDWTGLQSLRVAFKGSGGSGQSVVVRIESGEAGNWFEADFADVRGYDAGSTEPQILNLGIENFAPLTEGTELDPSNILSFGVFVKQTGGETKRGTLVFDNISWSDVPLSEIPGDYAVEIENTEWNATGSDTLMSLLQENAVITAVTEGLPADGEEPYILQVLYTSDNDEILKNEGLFSSKGVFRGEGTITVEIKEVTVYADGKQNYVNVNETVTINISELDEAVDVLEYLTALGGNGTLAAMHNKEPNARPRTSTDRIMEQTGITPAVWSGDFLYLADDVANRQKMIDEAIRQWNDGALINIMLHVPSPIATVEQEAQGSNWGNNNTGLSVQADLTDEQWESLLTEGGELNTNWKLRLDVYAEYLQQLKDAGVVPMFRPFHEMNQHVFWWAGVPANTAALYRMTKDYLVNEKGLDNMIWVWDLQDFDNRMNWQDYNPGDEYWDLLALDVYSGGYNQAYYEQMQKFANGKPIAIGECWTLMNTSQLAAFPNYVFAMPWADDTWVYNNDTAIQNFYHNTLNLLDTPIFAPYTSEPEKYVLGVDDYEAYASDDELNATYTANVNGDDNTITLVDPDHEGDSDQAMQFTYNLAGSGYTGVVRTLNGYWPGAETVSLWFKGDGLGQDILLQISDGDLYSDASHTYECHLNNVEGFDPASTDWQYLEIPIEQFLIKEGSGTINLKSIQSFALYVNAVGGAQVENSVLIIDDVMVTFSEKPELPGVTFNETEMYASGNDNLITTLRENITVSGEGELVQVQYEVDDSGILDVTTGMVPKGIFRSEGTVNLTVKKAQVYIDDATFVIDLNQEITIHVSDLAEPVDVVDYLMEITGNNLITSMHFDGSYSDADSLHERIANEFGTYPAFYSADFLTGGTVAQRQNMINEVIRQWNNGAIVQIMFHVSPPQYTVAQESQGTWGGDQWSERRYQPNHIYSFLYNDDWEELMTDGTELNTNWKLRMDEYARYLQQLEDAGVTVLLRPFHEMNQHVFWWGGRTGLDGTAGLYRMFHDYMENEKGLSNIIWVWDVQDMPENYGNEGDAKFAPYRADDVDQSTVIADYDAQDLDLFNPGADYYDIIALDFYDQGLNEPGDTMDHNHVYTQFWYDQVSEIAQRDGKPMFIGETWAMISPETWASQPNWSLCMPWGNRTWTHNATGAEGMKEHYQYFLNIEDTPTFATRVNGAVDVDPDAEAAQKSADEAAAAAEAAKKAAADAAAAAEAAKKAAEAAAAETAADMSAAEEAAKAADAAADAADVAADAAADADAAAGEAQKAADEADPEAAAEAAEEAKAAAALAQNAADSAASAADAAESCQKAQASVAEAEKALAEAEELAKQAAADREAAEKAKAEAEAAQKAAEAAAAEAALSIAKYEALLEVDDYAETLDADVSEELAAARKAITEAKTAEEVAAAVEAAKAAMDAASGESKCPSEKFADVEADGWYHEAVDFMVENGYMNGVSETKFDVAGSVTRAQLVTILYRIEGEPDVAGMENPFNDVKEGTWYTDAIVWAAENGIVNGVSPTSYAPDANITREQIVTILYRYAKAEAVAEDHLAGYTDAGKVSGYAKDAMNWAIANEIVNGMTEDTLAPTANASRAQICVILMRYLSK